MINFHNIQMVAFTEGDQPTVYAIRKGWIFHKYLDLSLSCNNWWWGFSKTFFVRDCTSGDYQKVKTIFLNLGSVRRRRAKQIVIKNP